MRLDLISRRLFSLQKLLQPELALEIQPNKRYYIETRFV
jgi:hypothetical protein